ncbi:MAG: hypothetical protein ACI4WT_09790 [Oligosphaeraceae bacterium]
MTHVRSHRLALLALAAPLLALALQFPTPQALMEPERWKSNSSGDMNVDRDAAEEALRISVTFNDKVDKWIYPQFRIRPPETLNGATHVSFDLKVVPGTTPVGHKFANVLCGSFVGFQPPKEGVWQHYRVALPKENDSRDLRSIAIGANPTTLTYTYLLKNITLEGTPMPRKLPPAIVCDAPATLFTLGQDVTIKTTQPLAGLAYTLKDWHGKTLMNAAWPADGAQPLVLKGLQPGYYTLDTTNDTATKLRRFSFIVVVSEESRMKALGARTVADYARARRNSAFAIDSAQSWVARPGGFDCPYFDGDSYLLASEVSRLTGIPHVRERLSWNEVQRRRDSDIRLDYYLRNAELLRERGILVSGMYHDAPTWADKITKLPRDLKAVYDFAKNVAELFGDRMGDWEFWNEQDIGFAPEAAWDYAPAMKAAYLGFRAANRDRLVANGAICTGAANPYVHAMYDNDIAKYTDLYNFHTYSPIASYDSIFRDIRQLFAKYGMDNRAIWCTEFGTHLEGYCTEDGVRPGLKAHTPEQEMILAEFYPKSQLRQMFLGGSRNYYFVLPPYNEGQGAKDWGLLRRDGSAKPSIAAFSTATAQLVAATMLGELNVGDACRAYLLQQPDGSQTVALWAISNLETATGGVLHITTDNATDVTLRLPDGHYALTDMMGAPSTLAVTGGAATLKVTRYPVYIAGLRGLKPDTPATPAGQFQRYQPAPDEDMTVVIRADLNPEDFTVGNRKSRAQMPNTTGRLRLQVWNLSDQPKRGHLNVQGASLDGVPDTIDLPAMGKAEFDAVLKPTYNKGQFLGHPVVITGTFNGKRSTRFSITCDLLGLFLQNCVGQELPWTNPDLWRKNSSAHEQTISYDEAEKALRFDFVWTSENDRWAYPEHLLKLPEESFSGARYLEFEIKSTQDKVENDFKTQLVMLVEGTEKELGKTHHLSYAPPMQQWEIRRVPLDDRDGLLSRIRQIRIGANPKGHRLTIWIRNVRLLKDR